jgi:hypothetical protein
LAKLLNVGVWYERVEDECDPDERDFFRSAALNLLFVGLDMVGKYLSREYANNSLSLRFKQRS